MWAVTSRRRLLAGLLASLAIAAPPSSRWNKIRYLGGTVDAKVNPFDWNATVTLVPGEIELLFAGRKRVSIPLARLTAISYGAKAHRRMADLGVTSIPGSLFGLMQKGNDHWVAIEYQGESGAPAGVLLTVHKDSYSDMLTVLRIATGKPVENWP